MDVPVYLYMNDASTAQPNELNLSSTSLDPSEKCEPPFSANQPFRYLLTYMQV